MASPSVIPVFSASLPVTRLGTLRLWATANGLRRLDLRGEAAQVRRGECLSPGDPPAHLQEALDALLAYVRGERTELDLPLDLGPATPFQRRVWDLLRRIPYGRVTTYGALARALGDPRVARAVGQAVGANPVPIVIPCHRVVRADLGLGGFGGGLPMKARLLRIEGVHTDGVRPSSRVRPEVLRLPL